MKNGKVEGMEGSYVKSMHLIYLLFLLLAVIVSDS